MSYPEHLLVSVLTQSMHSTAPPQLTWMNNTNNNDKNKNESTTKTRKQKWEEKQLYVYFKRQIGEISYEKNWTWLKKENLKRETKAFPMAAQNNAIKTNYVKAKIDYTPQNGKCRLCGDKNETIYHKISECNELVQKK